MFHTRHDKIAMVTKWSIMMRSENSRAKIFFGLVFLALLSSIALGQQTELPDHLTHLRGAEDIEAIPLGVVRYSLIRNFVTNEDQRPGEGVLLVSRVLDIEVEEARGFLENAKRALQRYDTLAARTAKSVCEMDIQSGEDWAKAMTAQERTYFDHQSSLVNEMASRTSPETWKKVVALADNSRKSTSILTTDYFKLLNVQSYRPLLAQQCN